MLPPWITATQFAALSQLVHELTARRISYVATGGLAGNAHGSAWPLQDIDVDVPASALRTVASLYATDIRFGPARYMDDEFDIELVTIVLGDVTIDVTACETIRLRDHAMQAWVSWPTDLHEAEVRVVGGLPLRVQPLERLIAYKRIIGRAADLADLADLEAALRRRGIS